MTSRAEAQISYPSPPRFQYVPWEYRVVDINDFGGEKDRHSRLQAQLDSAGKDGWELVEVPYVGPARYQTMVFKRSRR